MAALLIKFQHGSELDIELDVCAAVSATPRISHRDENTALTHALSWRTVRAVHESHWIVCTNCDRAYA